MSGKDHNLDWMISVDDHVIEPPNVWQDRLPARYRDVAPRLEVSDGKETWVYEDKRMSHIGLSASAGKGKDEVSTAPLPYSEMRPGCYDPKARLEDMDRAGILASLNFPSLPRSCGQLFYEAKDKELGLLCVQAYNDWMIDEWCGTAPGRFIPLTLIPLWDPGLAVQEIERCAAKGSRGISFSENTAPLGLPTIHDRDGYWLPVMSAANDAQLVVCMHVGSSSTIPSITTDSPWMANLSWGASRTSGAMLSWLFSGYFQRFPDLKIALSEGEVGWIPFFLQRAEQVYNTQRGWVNRGEELPGLSQRSASTGDAALDAALRDFDLRQLYQDHVFGCFIDDVVGLKNLDDIGEDNVMIESDYPHPDSTWPNSMKIAKECLTHLSPEVQYKILQGNAQRVFRFQAATPPGD